MKKTAKMVLYGNPGTGKSVFACKSPKPFFITTDGNYEWLDEFGAKEEDHIQVNSWEEAKKAFNKSYDEYDTIVVDLIEDLFKWCETEFCTKNRISHIGDLGFGKGYDLTRNEFFIEICKLLNKEKNIILISHGNTVVEKDRRGVEHTKYEPSSRIPAKLWDMIEGRVRYFLRCYLKAEEIEDSTTVIKRRFLSFIPKENEFGVCRGINESLVPQDIPLEWSEFAKLIGLEKFESSPIKEKNINNIKETKNSEKIENKENTSIENSETVNISIDKEETEVKDEVKDSKVVDNSNSTINKESSLNEEIPEQKIVKKEDNKSSLSNADKLAAIKAKIAAQKAAMNK